MPNFTIRRRRKEIQPPPAPTEPTPPEPKPVEEKVDEMEISEQSESEEELISKALTELRVEKPQHRPQIVRNVENRPQRAFQLRPQRQEFTRPVRKEPEKNPYAKLFGPTPRINDPYTRKPRMRQPVLRRRGKKCGVKLRFRSHYGANSEHYDTHTNSNLLYNHCFG